MLIAGVLLATTTGCATREEWQTWKDHPTHFASGDHLSFSVRNTDGSKPQVTPTESSRPFSFRVAPCDTGDVMALSTAPAYAEFPIESIVRIASRAVLDNFLRAPTDQHRLYPVQLQYADAVSEVEMIVYFHGGNEAYCLRGIPGMWLERCLIGEDESG